MIALGTWIAVLFLQKPAGCFSPCLLLKLCQCRQIPEKCSLPLCLPEDERRDIAESYLITIPAQSNTSTRSFCCVLLRKVVYSTSPTITETRARHSRTKKAGWIPGKEHKGTFLEWYNTLRRGNRRKRCFRKTLHIFTTKDVRASGNRFFSLDYFRSFYNQKSRNMGLQGSA